MKKENEKVQRKNVQHTHTLTPVEILQTSSVELKRNAKGETEIRVKVYNKDFKEAMNEAAAGIGNPVKKLQTEVFFATTLNLAKRKAPHIK